MGFFRFFDETVDFFISDIRKQTGKGFIETFTDKGNYGEFLSYKYLINTPGKRDYIHNCYIPTANGFTEIDFLLLHDTGVYVVESKNYSGWIFGDEKSKNWTQVLAGGKTRNRFLNPIHQNAGHIKALKAFLKDYPDLRYYSLIVFSERCELKKVSCTLPDTYVVKRDDLKSIFKRQIKELEKLPLSMLAEVGALLKPLCCVGEAEKVAHIERIKAIQTRAGRPVPLAEPIAQDKDVANLESTPDINGETADEDILTIDEATAAEIAASEATMEDALGVAVEQETEADPEDKMETVEAQEIATITDSADGLVTAEASTYNAATDTFVTEKETKNVYKNKVVESIVEASRSIFICPRCHKPLIERKGKNGTFIGCTGFPHCRYTRSIT